ncbi:hypothetical protein QUA74_20085 [Microcoleus sp. LAD1_D3]|uniref:hypothetical protein n=1 Tax=Microcoleus sp. LAD1_D3 TaxID=2819365 RepID=UPI002FD18940
MRFEISGLRFLASQNLTSNVKFWLADNGLLKFTALTRFDAKNRVASYISPPAKPLIFGKNPVFFLQVLLNLLDLPKF